MIYTYLKIFEGQTQNFQLCSNSFPYFTKEFENSAGDKIKYNQYSRIIYSLDSKKYLIWVLKPSTEKYFANIPLMEIGKCFSIFKPKLISTNKQLDPLNMILLMNNKQYPISNLEVKKIKKCEENYYDTEECHKYINHLKKIAIIL